MAGNFLKCGAAEFKFGSKNAGNLPVDAHELIADVLAWKVPSKLQIFLSAWASSSDQRRALAHRHSGGTTRVWCWAPGFIYPDRQDLERHRRYDRFQGAPSEPFGRGRKPDQRRSGAGTAGPVWTQSRYSTSVRCRGATRLLRY